VNALPSGFAIGHWNDPVARTGCTAILCPPATVGGCDVRGASPGSRELALLQSDKKMQEVHAVLLTGGSAYGLAAADGVMQFLEEQSIGYRTPWGLVPIVPAAVVFDLNVGSSVVRPNAHSGYEAARAARDRGIQEGSVGAGTGTTVGKWAGLEHAMRGGFGLVRVERESFCLSAAAVVNCVGDVIDDQGNVIAGARDADGAWLVSRDPSRSLRRGTAILPANTVLVAILTDALLTKVDANRVSQRAHDGLARAVRPAHTSFDGDTVFCVASGPKKYDLDAIAEAATEATEDAIRRAVLSGQMS
jgi:L-aminopeptidase/D-esterase-like protein